MSAAEPPADSGKPSVGAEVKGAALDIGVSTVVGAARGAVVGGAAGAVASGAKSAVAATARTPFVRKVLIGGSALLLVAVVALGFAFVSGAAAAVTAIAGSADQNSEYAIEDDDVPTDVKTAASEVQEQFGIPRELAISVLQANDGYDFTAMSGAIEEVDPDRALRDMSAGATVSSAEVARSIPISGPGADIAKQVREMYVGAMVKGGFSAPQAEDIYEIALHWVLGNTVDPELEACLTPVGPVDGEDVVLNGTRFTAGQVANMKIVIGMAKTMFPNSAQAATTVGLITVQQESAFRNYANDGIMTPARDPNPGPFGPADYAHLAYSLDLPHDAVGTDHSSLGLMQQQATMGWGDYQASTWANGDYKAVITRLMSPAFTIGKFFTRLDRVAGWQTMEPGRVAQRIQVSAFPDAYARHIALAGEIWRHYGAIAPALAVPESTGWLGDVTDEDGEGGPVCPGSPFLLDGEYSWPIEASADGLPTGFVSSKYGYRIINGQQKFHSGLDVTGRGYGSEIYSVAAGTVVKSNLWSAACGEYVKVAHADGTATGYLHMTDRLVKVGDTVTAGQLLAHMGGGQPGGCTFGAHLHLYAYDQHGTLIDPQEYLAQRGLIFAPHQILFP